MIINTLLACDNPAYATLLSTVKRVMLLVQIIAPIALIISGSIGFYQLMQNPDEKNGAKKIFNRFIAAVLVFFVPMFMDFVMTALGESTTISSCWKNANEKVTPVSGASGDDNSGKNKIITDPGSYQPGNPGAKPSTKKSE